MKHKTQSIWGLPLSKLGLFFPDLYYKPEMAVQGAKMEVSYDESREEIRMSWEGCEYWYCYTGVCN